MPKTTFPARPYILTRPVEEFEYDLIGAMPPKKKDYWPIVGLLLSALSAGFTVMFLFSLTRFLMGAS